MHFIDIKVILLMSLLSRYIWAALTFHFMVKEAEEFWSGSWIMLDGLLARIKMGRNSLLFNPSASQLCSPVVESVSGPCNSLSSSVWWSAVQPGLGEVVALLRSTPNSRLGTDLQPESSNHCFQRRLIHYAFEGNATDWASRPCIVSVSSESTFMKFF